MREKAQNITAEKRFAPRRPRQLPAIFFVDGLPNGVRCTIVDLSSTGARILVNEGWDATLRYTGGDPQRLRLTELKEKVTYDCWIVRQQPKELGLRFAAPPILPPLASVRKVK